LQTIELGTWDAGPWTPRVAREMLIHERLAWWKHRDPAANTSPSAVCHCAWSPSERSFSCPSYYEPGRNRPGSPAFKADK